MRIRFDPVNGSNIIEERVLMKRIEYVQTKRKIYQFSTFLPDAILLLHASTYAMSHTHHFVGVLLCVDINGIIELIERYCKGGLGELYKMSINLNAYIGSIIEVLRSYGGDVLTIFSNSFITLWKVQPEQSMYEILHTVVVCANVIQKLLGVYDTDVNVPLMVKTAVSCGNVSIGIPGDYDINQVVIVGDAFESLRHSIKSANFGDVIVTSSAWPHMLQERYTVTVVAEGFKILKISYKSSEVTKKAFFDEKYVYVVSLIEKHYQHRNILRSLLVSTRVLTNNKIIDKFVKQLPQREEIKLAPKFWSVEDMKPLLNEVVFAQITESQPVEYLTEIREVTDVYFMIIPRTFDPPSLLNTINLVLRVIIENLKDIYATINHVFVTESGILINVVFGLVLINHENESLNALKFSYKIKASLQTKASVVGVSCGIASGIVYCSVIGHPLRREYAIIGRPVFKARSLAERFQDKVTCNYKIYNTSKLSSLYFKLALEEVDDNGETDYIFEFNEGFDSTEERIHLKPLVDRISDYNLIMGMLQKPSVVGFSGILLQGPEMIGKSMLISHIHEDTRQNSTYVSVLVTLIAHKSHPYYCISEIYTQIFDQIYKITGRTDTFLNLPRKLVTFSEADDFDDEIALQKYRTLNYFRDLVSYSQRTVVILIDNVEFIDLESWEILEMSFPSPHLRLVLSSAVTKIPKQMHKRIKDNFDIRIKELLPLKSRYITSLACGFFNVRAISNNLANLLMLTCDGVPGYVECCLLRLVNNETIELKFSSKDKLDTTAFSYISNNLTNQMTNVFPILDFSSDKMLQEDALTMDIIYLDLFDSFTPFQQLVVKTASLLGSLFGRTLLMITLNYPSDQLLADSIRILFEERIFECGTRYVTSKQYDARVICCRCYFDDAFFTEERQLLPKYSYCKLIHFRNGRFQSVAYERIPQNQRHELHVLCAEVLERMEHICPNCVRNPANYYAFFGNYKEFLEFCRNPATVPNYDDFARDSYENIKTAIKAHFEVAPSGGISARRPSGDGYPTPFKIDEKYLPLKRVYDPKSCQCLEMLHVIYQDLILHAQQSNEFGKVTFYKLKFGLIQLCMRNIIGAIKTLQETRELSLVNFHRKDKEISENFRRYHIGKASIALAICNMKIRDTEAAKNNIILALRQYNVPTLAFNFKHFKFLLHRRHLNLKTLKPLNTKHSAFGWEMGIAMFVCAKIFAMENNWLFARDCCEYSLSLLKIANYNISIIVDIYCDAIEICRKSGDNETCERLQKYIIREFQAKYTQNDTFYMHTLLQLLDVVINVQVTQGNIKKAIRLGYRLVHITEQSKIASINPSVLALLCELNIYTLYFQDFIDMLTLLTRQLNSNHSSGFLLHYLMAMLCYNYTGFYVITFDDVVKFAKNYYFHKSSLTNKDYAFKLLIRIQMLRRGRYERAKQWDVDFDYSDVVLSNCKIIKIMLFQLEGNLILMAHNLRLSERSQQEALHPKIEVLFELIKKAVQKNLLYVPAYLSLWAWYLMLIKRKSKSRSVLKKLYDTAKKYDNQYYTALAIRLKNFWDGGFDFELRPHVSINKAPTYNFNQFTQFLHPFVID